MAYLNIKILIIEVKKLVLIKSTISPFSVIQRCQVHQIFVFYLFYRILKEKDYIRRKVNSKKRNVYMWNQYYCYFDLPKIGVGWDPTTKNYVASALFLLAVSRSQVRIISRLSTFKGKERGKFFQTRTFKEKKLFSCGIS